MSGFGSTGIVSLWPVALLCFALQVFGTGTGSDRLQMPTAVSSHVTRVGLQPLEGRPHSGQLYVPRSGGGALLPVLILLHGAGRDSSDWFPVYEKYAEAGRFVVVAPEASGKTWGGGMRDFGSDVAVINRALAVACTKCAIDRSRVAIGGFSDGASYAMSLGLANGDIVSNVVAFSPGYFIGKPQRGKAAFFISAGVSDPILPVDQCSRRFVDTLRGAAYRVEYKEFFGGHEVTAAVSESAMAWLREPWKSDNRKSAPAA